jgi:predicted Co/Zn/Cd cation transporter (cation efflux family)
MAVMGMNNIAGNPGSPKFLIDSSKRPFKGILSMISLLPVRWLTPKRLLWASIAVAITTIVLKTLAWYVTDSVGLLSDAMESFVNLASAIFALMMVTIAQRPADDAHPYGHHKAEYFSSGFEGILIIGVAIVARADGRGR